MGLLKKNKFGFYKPEDKILSANDTVKNELLKQYQLKCMEIAKNIFFKNNQTPQRAITKTISLSQNGYDRVDKKLIKVSSEINSIIHKDEDQADRIYQLNLLLVPHSK